MMDWAKKIREYVAFGIIIIGIGAWAGDTQWVPRGELETYFDRSELNRIEEQIQFLETKISQGEASKTDQLFIEALKRKRERLLTGK